MAKSLFSELRRIGIDDEVAAKVSTSLDPDYIATKKDVLIMQEALLQHQARSDERYLELKTEMIRGFAELKTDISDVKTELRSEIADVRAEVSDVRAEVADVRAEVADVRAEVSDVRAEVADVRAEVADVRTDVANVRSEVGSMHRQYWITFLGLMTTILAMFSVNWYFHNF